MATRDSIRKWVNRHTNKHKCLCGCDEYIEIVSAHHRRGIPKYLKGHNFYGPHNPRTEEDIEVTRKSPIWEMLSEEEKERRKANLNKFGKLEEHPQWKGGRIKDESGYIRIRMSEHPFAKDGYMLEHRHVMEEFLILKYPKSHYLTKVKGKLYLKQKVVVHHVDEVKDNNMIENLFPFPDSAAHTFWHKSSLSDKEKIALIKNGQYRTHKNKEPDDED